MALDLDDLKFLDGKFSDLHDRLNETSASLSNRMTTVEAAVRAIKQPCLPLEAFADETRAKEAENQRQHDNLRGLIVKIALFLAAIGGGSLAAKEQLANLFK